MSVAALYDVHGNLPALEAVLAEPDVQAADRLVLGGDIVGGPFPRQTLDAVLALGDRALLIRGNGERELTEVPPEGLWGLRTRWAAEQLTAEEIERLASLPLAVVLPVEGRGPVHFCHASPRRDDEIVTRSSPGELLDELSELVRETTIVLGHTHVQFDRDVGGTRIVNAGSVGMPYEGLYGAYWALLDDEIELRRTPYDVVAAGERIRATEFPFPDELVATLSSPPAADEATELFEQMAAERGER